MGIMSRRTLIINLPFHTATVKETSTEKSNPQRKLGVG